MSEPKQIDCSNSANVEWIKETDEFVELKFRDQTPSTWSIHGYTYTDSGKRPAIYKFKKSEK